MKDEPMCNVPDTTLEKLQADIAEIKVALLGNEYNPTGGLLCRTTDNTVKLANLEKRVDKAYYMLLGGSAVITVLINLLAWLIERQ